MKLSKQTDLMVSAIIQRGHPAPSKPVRVIAIRAGETHAQAEARHASVLAKIAARAAQ